MNNFPIIVISDCAGDEDGRGRIAAQVEYEFGRPATAIQHVCGEVQAAGFLASQLHLARQRPSVIIPNVAPRNGGA
ncbi:hypothetical protein HZA86_01655 [Candidatus Uhrbacteria bacterium]|nr:hypothetical protein [Candidatus Uhrbacteria bacterium]